MLLAAQQVAAAPVIGLMAFGVVVALIGHIVRDKRVVLVGITVLFAATFLMIAGAYVAYNGDETDPRPLTRDDGR